MFTVEQLKEYIAAHEEQFVIHCKTQEEAEEYLGMLSKIGFVWSANTSITFGNEIETRWHLKKADTCYTFIPGSSILLTGRIKFYQNKGLNIIEYEDFKNQFSQISVPTIKEEKTDLYSKTPKMNNVSNTLENFNNTSENKDYIFCPQCNQKIKKTSK